MYEMDDIQSLVYILPSCSLAWSSERVQGWYYIDRGIRV